VQAGPGAEAVLNIDRSGYRVGVNAGLSGALGVDVTVDLLVEELNLYNASFPLFSIDLGWLYQDTFTRCGDGLLMAGEGCDPGEELYGVPGSGAENCVRPGEPSECTCTGRTQRRTGSFDPFELEWGVGYNYCESTARCGDGIVDPGEACDDGLPFQYACGECVEGCTRIQGLRNDGITDFGFG